MVYDKFGEDTQMISSGKDSLVATVKVQISPTFWGWIFRFVDLGESMSPQMQILSPVGLAEKYRERAAIIINNGENPKTKN